MVKHNSVARGRVFWVHAQYLSAVRGCGDPHVHFRLDSAAMWHKIFRFLQRTQAGGERDGMLVAARLSISCFSNAAQNLHELQASREQRPASGKVESMLDRR